MDLLIVAFYTVCDDLLIQHRYQDDPRTKMSASEVMTTTLVAAQLFGGNQQMARQLLKEQGYIPHKLNQNHIERLTCHDS